MKEVTEEMYRKYSKNVECIARSFSKTTSIEPDELVAHAWTKITYAIRFHDEKKSKESTFISLIARTAMTEIWEEQKTPIRAGLVSFEGLVTEDENEHDNSSMFYWDSLSSCDDTFLVDIGFTISENAKAVAKAVVEQGLESKAAIYQWGKDRGMRKTEITFCIFEIQLALQGKRVNYV